MHDGHNAPFLAGQRMRLFRIASLLLAIAVSAPAHAVVTTSTRSTEVTGAGQTVFTVPFPFADAASLVVKKILLSTSASTTLALGTGYTVTLPVGTVSGKVTTTAAVSSSYKLRIERSTPATQTTAFGSQGAFYPALHEKALDKLTMAIQDVAVSGGSGGGGSGTPSSSTPAAVSTTGSAGAATEYSRGDHAHAIALGTINSAVGTGALDGNARVSVRKNSAGSVLARRRLNLIEGSNVTLTVNDDSGSEEVDVTIASAGGGGTVDFASVNAALSTANANIGVNNNKITGLASPTSSGDAVNQSYLVDYSGDTPWKYAVRAATTVTNGLTGNVTIDGVALAFPDRILVKNQITTSQNGIYVVSSGAWARATDADEAGEFTTGMSVWVSEGTTQSDTLWALNTNDPITVGSTSLAFTQVDQKAITASNGLQRTFNNILVAPDGIDASMLANMAANTIKGRITGSTGNPEDLTAANVRTIISAVSGSASAYLDGTGAFSIPSGGGGSGSLAWKDPVRLATTANITLSGAQTIDGVSAIANDRVLVKNQTTGSQNGIYAVAAGSWTRVTDMDTSGETYSGQVVAVQEGTANADSVWELTTNAAITLDTTALTFALISGTAYSSTPAAVSTTGSAGSSALYAPGDHVHAITVSTINAAVTGTGLDVTGAASTAGVKGTGGATNANGIEGVGAGTGSGVKGTGGATGKGVEGIGGASGGSGVTGTASAGGNVGVVGFGSGSGAGVSGTGGSSGRGGDFTGGASNSDGVRGTGGATNGIGVVGVGTGTGAGGNFTGGATSAGVTGSGGSSTGVGVVGVGTGNNLGVRGNGNGTGAGVQGTGGATGSGGSFFAGSTSGYGVVITGDTTTPINAALSLVPQDTQPSGPNVVGDTYVTSAGVMKICTVAGTPGTWANVGDSAVNSTVTLTSDVTGSGTGSFATTIANDAVSNAKLANMATATFKGRTTAGTGDPEDLTSTQATAMMNSFTSSLQGVVLPSGGGTTNFLRADGTWNAPSGGGGGGGSGAWHDPVRVATTANITLSGTQTIDGVSVAAADRVLVKNQTTGSQNGIYACASGSWTRVSDMDASGEAAPGMVATVSEGTANADTAWVLTTDATITLDTTTLTFAQIDQKAVLAGTGLTRTTNTLAVNASQSISTLNNLTTNGFVKTGGGVGTLSVDTSTYLTGNQTVTISGDVTGSGATAITSTIANDAVSYAKIQNVSATDKLLGRSSSGAGDIEEIALTAAGRAIIDDADAAAQRTTLGLGTLSTQSGTFSGTSSGTNTGDQTITLTGDVTGTGTGSFAATVANDAITYAKMQNVSATDKLLGRSTAGAGDVEEIALTAAGRALIDDTDAAAQRTTLGLGTAATLTAGAWDTWHFQAESLDDADANWPTTANAVMVDSVSTASVQTRKFLGASATAAGGKFTLPTGSTTCKFSWAYQASSAPGTTNNKVRWRLDFRPLGGTASMTTYTFADQTNANNTTMALFSDTETHATTGMSTATPYQFQIVRVTSGVTNNMTQDAYTSDFNMQCY